MLCKAVVYRGMKGVRWERGDSNYIGVLPGST